MAIGVRNPFSDNLRNMSTKLSDQIRALRRQRKVTQVELSARAGVSQSAVSDLERGKDGATLRTVNSILAVLRGHLQVHADDLEDAPDAEVPARVTSIMRRLADLHPWIGDEALYVIEALLDRAEQRR